MLSKAKIMSIHSKSEFAKTDIERKLISCTLRRLSGSALGGSSNSTAILRQICSYSWILFQILSVQAVPNKAEDLFQSCLGAPLVSETFGAHACGLTAVICRDLRNINVARRPGLLSRTLHTFLAPTSQTCCRWTDSLPLAHQPLFSLPYWEEKQLLLCAENSSVAAAVSAPAPWVAAGRGAFLDPSPLHNLSGALAVFRLLWPTLELISYLSDSQWTLCLFGTSSSWRVGVAASVNARLRPFTQCFVFKGDCVISWPLNLRVTLVCSFFRDFEYKGDSSFAVITDTEVFSDSCSPRRLKLQQPITFEDQAGWVRV